MKEEDKDVNYDETKVPAYDLPELLVTAEGRRITTAEEWYSLRRPQIMSLFSNLVYGRVPEPSTPIKLTFREVKKDEAFMRGKATRKDVEIQIKTEKGAKTMRILLFVPNGVTKPVPAFMKAISIWNRPLVCWVKGVFSLVLFFSKFPGISPSPVCCTRW